MNCFYWQEGFAAPEEGGNNEEYEYNDEQEEYQTEETYAGSVVISRLAINYIF